MAHANDCGLIRRCCGRVRRSASGLAARFLALIAVLAVFPALPHAQAQDAPDPVDTVYATGAMFETKATP